VEAPSFNGSYSDDSKIGTSGRGSTSAKLAAATAAVHQANKGGVELALRDFHGHAHIGEDSGLNTSTAEYELTTGKARAIAYCDSLISKHKEAYGNARDQKDIVGARFALAGGQAESILRGSISSMTNAEFNVFEEEQTPERQLEEVLATLQKFQAQFKFKKAEVGKGADLRLNDAVWLAEVKCLDECIAKLKGLVRDLKAKLQQDVGPPVPEIVQEHGDACADLGQARSRIDERCTRLEEKYAKAKAKRQRRDVRLQEATSRELQLQEAEKCLAETKKKISQGNFSREMASRLTANAIAKCNSGKAKTSLIISTNI
jgi:hypothetical protein